MKNYILVLVSFLFVDFTYCQSKAVLIRSIEELKVANVQNQTKIESLQKDVENLKVRVTISEAKIQSQEKEISRLNQLLNENDNQVVDFNDSDLNESNSTKRDTAEDIVATNVQIKANFPGGEVAFRSYLEGEFIYPQRCKDKGINGSVMLRFVVDEAGRISRVKAIEETKSCPEFTTEAIRILKKSPRWVPGQNNGTFLKSWREIPLRMSVN
jgi:protein TonB